MNQSRVLLTAACFLASEPTSTSQTEIYAPLDFWESETRVRVVRVCAPRTHTLPLPHCPASCQLPALQDCKEEQEERQQQQQQISTRSCRRQTI